MYNVPHFKASNEYDVVSYMRKHPFIILCGVDAEGKPVATHVPVLIEQREDKIFLLAHIMRKQEHTKAFENNPNVLAVFSGVHTYVSASWYEEKDVASTWNYQAVHAKGRLTFLDDYFLRALLIRLTEKFESNMHSPSLVQKMDEGYVTSLMKAIVAFEIEITSVEHVFKLSQNRDEKSFENIIKELDQKDLNGKAIAAEMKERKDFIFPK